MPKFNRPSYAWISVLRCYPKWRRRSCNNRLSRSNYFRILKSALHFQFYIIIMLKRFGYGLASWCRRKVLDPLHLILRRGAEPKQLAFSAALGITFGLFPICGVTVFLCGIAIAILGSLCHAPTVMLANFIATPIELSLMVPFLRFGEFITGGPHFPLTSDALKKVLTGQASREVLQSILHALLGWLVAAPFILGGLYILCLPCFKILVYKFSEVPSSPKKPLISSPRKSIGSPSEVRLKVRDV